MKKKLVLKPFVIPALYTVFAIVVISSLFLSIEVVKDKDDITYVNGVILDEYVPVINTNPDEKIVKPFNKEDVEKTKDYYDYKGEEQKQANSIILHDNTYIQNTGINYSSDETFDVVSILDGEVIEVKEKELLGKSVTIKHANDIISVYQSLKDINVKQGDTVKTGQKIGTSGKCDLIKDKENNLHFELYIGGEIQNPEDFFDKALKEI